MFLYLNITLFIALDDLRWLGHQLIFIALGIGLILQYPEFWHRNLTYIRGYIRFSEKPLSPFIIDEHGEVSFAGERKQQLLPKSQVTFLGYLLIFQHGNKKPEKHFIFKDSLSRQDNARLARIIFRLRNS